jgi:DNA-binding transcriptional MerR regulator
MEPPRPRRSPGISYPRGVSIAEVSRRTGIPPSTLRFYEREMPGLFLIRKTPGGHRRYDAADIERFSTIRRLTQTESIPLAEVRRVLSSRGDHEPLKEEVSRLRASQEEGGWTLAELARRVTALEEKLRSLGGARGKRRWFGKT